MKKILISALATLGMAAISLPAFALEHEFGGYWRTRAYTQQDFGPDGSQDLSQVDTRTELYYTAKFSENFKFVNKFEFNTNWGDSTSDDTTMGGGIGADGTNDFRIKNSYVDLTFRDWNVKVGLQGEAYARGFLFDDDFAGITLTYNGTGFNIPIVWMKATEGGIGDHANDFDVDALLISPTFDLNENISLNPFVMYMRSDDIAAYNLQYEDYYGAPSFWGDGSGLPFPPNAEKADLFYIGLNADFHFDMFSAWFTAIYGFGTIDKNMALPPWGGTGNDYDMSGFLVALGGEVDFDFFNIHAQAFCLRR